MRKVDYDFGSAMVTIAFYSKRTAMFHVAASQFCARAVVLKVNGGGWAPFNTIMPRDPPILVVIAAGSVTKSNASQ